MSRILLTVAAGVLISAERSGSAARANAGPNVRNGHEGHGHEDDDARRQRYRVDQGVQDGDDARYADDAHLFR